jgi:putative membrane protein
MKTLALATLSALLVAGCTHRSSSTGGNYSEAGAMGSSSGAAAQLSSDDMKFVRQAAQSGMAEVKMGQLASQNGQDSAIKELGQRLVQDHNKANQELAQIASQKGVTMPMQMDSSDQSMIDRLSNETGTAFDNTFRKDAVTAHEKAIKEFKSAAENCKDPELKAFAQKTLPVLQEHLDMAKKLSSGSSQGTSTQ